MKQNLYEVLTFDIINYHGTENLPVNSSIDFPPALIEAKSIPGIDP
jgi:hypothetical protein